MNDPSHEIVSEVNPPLDLPPVDPPSARFILQLFVIPFVVVVILVCILLIVYGLFGKLATGGQDALEYVQIIRSGNENRRWRAAYELASQIHNEPNLARDSKLQNELGKLLADELRDPADDMKVETPQYLALALGAFDKLEGTDTPAPSGAFEALLRALESDVPAVIRAAAAQSLSIHAAKPGAHISSNLVVPALVNATKSDDSDLRRRAAYALGYFDTPESRAALAASTGSDDRLTRYDAASALARLDDPASLGVMREMLSTHELESAFASELKNNSGPSRAMIEAVQLEALSALSDALAKDRNALTLELKPELETLARDGTKNVQMEVRTLLQKRQKQG
jgi:hypothetical protein